MDTDPETFHNLSLTSLRRLAENLTEHYAEWEGNKVKWLRNMEEEEEPDTVYDYALALFEEFESRGYSPNQGYALVDELSHFMDTLAEWLNLDMTPEVVAAAAAIEAALEEEPEPEPAQDLPSIQFDSSDVPRLT